MAETFYYIEFAFYVLSLLNASFVAPLSEMAV